MSKIILDASAVLAVLNQEPGSSIVERHLTHSLISTVNLCEVITILCNIGMDHKTATKLTDEILNKIIPFDKEQAAIAAELRNVTKALGLSLGDRACLGLAKLYQIPVLTADALWAKLDINIDIQLIR